MKTMKIELSPAAQAVKDAALSMYADCNVRRMAWPLDMPVVAAALRALAVRIKGADAVRQDVLDIADELEGVSG
jgi:hypothetical protein